MSGRLWHPLREELDRWAASGLTLPLWWRDDDATGPGAALSRLADLSGKAGLPVHLAIIPARAGPALGRALASAPDLIPLVHGWAHESHAPPGEKKAEFGGHRPAAIRLDEAGRGLGRLTDLLGRPPAPVFVPPWNRIAPDISEGLAALGFRALSTFGARPAPAAAPGLARINTHLDPIDWRGSRSLVAPVRLVAEACALLAARREGRADPREPFGLLTHHLVHDAAIWEFVGAFLSHLTAGPVTIWRADRALGARSGRRDKGDAG